MPTYEYMCGKCGFRDTFIRTMAMRDTPPCCRKCGSDTERVVSFAGIVWAPTAGGHR